MHSRHFASSLVLFALALGCSPARRVRFDLAGPTITVHRPALYPETIEYDAERDRFLLGSFREGAIDVLDERGNISTLVDDPRLCSVLGIAVDSRQGRLWAVNSDLGASSKPSLSGPKNLASVATYDLKSGRALDYVDLAPLVSEPHLLNGIALDAAGVAYVSDSFAPVIYEVGRGKARVLLRDERFAGVGINLNGLVVHPDGYLLVVKKNDGSLFKIPLDTPDRFSQVKIPERLVGGDGLTLISNRELVVIANRTPEQASNAAYALSSDDAWQTARVTAVQALGDLYPTTAVVRKGTLYVVQSGLNELIALPAEKKAGLRAEATVRPIARVDR